MHDDDDLRLLIGRMDAKLDLLLTRHDKFEVRLESVERTQNQMPDMRRIESRLSSLESWKQYAIGALAVVTTVVSIAVQFAQHFITR